MSKYTTGELAKLCGVSVRTVQYYDQRNILIPGEVSDGGHRLYTEEDANRLKIICFLRSMDMSINSIGELFREEYPENLITILLDRQEQSLRDELRESQKKLDAVTSFRQALQNTTGFSVESIGDIAHIMQSKNKLKKLRAILVLTGIPVSALQWVSIILWILQGIWWLFAVWCAVGILYGTWASVYYMKHVAYICPNCHTVFHPKFKDAFWAYHTPTARKLTCPNCKHHGLCVEVYRTK